MRRGTTVNLIWAFGFPDRLYHGLKNRGTQMVMFDQTLDWSTANCLATGLLIASTAVFSMLF